MRGTQKRRIGAILSFLLKGGGGGKRKKRGGGDKGEGVIKGSRGDKGVINLPRRFGKWAKLLAVGEGG